MFGATGHAAVPFNNLPLGSPTNFRMYGNQYLSLGPEIQMFVTGIPEPSTAALLVIGCVVALIARRR
jgi:hypothetical protein